MTIALGVGACATIHNLPLNKPSANPFSESVAQAAAVAARDEPRRDRDGAVIGLAFSGGGTRAAAFAYGVLRQLEAMRGPHGDLIDHVNIVSGVSGGSITAAYFGLKGRAGLADFRQNFLDQDLMSELNTSRSSISAARSTAASILTRDCATGSTRIFFMMRPSPT